MVVPPENKPGTIPGPKGLIRSSAAGKPSENPVGMPIVPYNQMSGRFWNLVDDLLGGTRAMREAGTKWLPKNAKEEQADYDERISRSFLYGAYADTVDDLSGRPFGKPVTIDEEVLPEPLDAIPDNVDRAGSDVDTLAEELFRDGINRGLFHVLVDMPSAPRNEQGVLVPLTKADERRLGIRPTLVRIDPKSLIGWRSRRDSNGEQILTQIRIKECTTEDDGDFGVKEVQRIRVYNEQTWELWEKRKNSDGKEDWLRIDVGVNTLGKVPLVTRYFNRTGFMTAKPPLMDLAWANLEHWQSSSEQRHILHYARVPFLFGSGFTEEEIGRGVEVGSTRMLRSTNKEADLKYVEIGGTAITAGANDIKSIEERMEILGLQPLQKASASSTATKARIDEDRQDAVIFQWIRQVEGALYNSFILAGEWVRVELPEDFTVSIYRDFSLGRSGSDMEHIHKFRDRGDLTQETSLREAQRRGILDESVNIEEEIQKTGEEEARKLSAFAAMQPAEEEEEEKEEQNLNADDE